MNGYLLVDKPKGWTSFDVVAKVRSLARQATGDKKIKVGHAGTLDPMATGLLIVLIGNYTKKQDEFMKLDKVYEAELTLGATSDTYDAEGTITSVSDVVPSVDLLQQTLNGFIGSIEQMPPAYSALKINGKKAYELARKGVQPDLKSRKVTIYSIDDINYDYPKLAFGVHVSSGTYVRSLANDIGQKVNLGAYLSNLRRTRIGDYNISKAILITDITSENLSSKLTDQ